MILMNNDAIRIRTVSYQLSPTVYSAFFNAGIISTKGHFPQIEDETISDYLTIGPLTRYAEDLSLVMKAFTLKYDRDLRLNAPIDLKHFKIYYRKGLKKTFGMLSIKPEIEQCVLKVIDHFSQCDIRTEEVLRLLVHSTHSRIDVTLYIFFQLSIEWPKAMLEITLAYYMKAKNPPVLLISADDQKVSIFNSAFAKRTVKPKLSYSVI